jgi:hypothetical protein
MRSLLGAALLASVGVSVWACGGGSSSPGGGPAPKFSLTVARSGSGSGTVTSSPAGIDCGTACVQSFASGTSLTLTATPDVGSVFVGWTGGSCSGADTCQLVITAATSETAIFEQPTGPYAVQQTESLGGETLSGLVCDIAAPFSVPAVAPTVSWTFNFSPTSAAGGAVTYAYSIPSAGESHDATGTYTIGPPAPADGSRVLAMSVRDHVVFKGFDGTIPLSYQFDLVPSNLPCP